MRFSLHDGPGIRTTVFLKGCPLACAWCHNPESQSPLPELMLRPNLCIACLECVSACPQGAVYVENGPPVTRKQVCLACGTCAEVCAAGARELVGRRMSVQAVLAEVLKDLPFYDQSGGGVTISGGEPLQQPEFLRALLSECQRSGLHTALDTCGHAPWQALELVRPYVDLFLYDIKAVDEHLHRQVTGVCNDLVLNNLRRLCQLGHSVILRLPLIPGVNDSPAHLRAAAALAGSLPGVLRLDLLPYHPAGVEKYRRLQRPYTLAEARAPAAKHLDEAVLILETAGVAVQVGG